MHASYQIIIQALWIAYIAHKHCILNLKFIQMQASTWICTYQLQSIKFMSLLPLHVCFSCPRMLILLNNAPLDPCHIRTCTLSSSLYLCPNISYIFVQISPLLSLITIKGRNHMKFVMWRSMDTLWRQSWCKEFDLGRWLSLDSLCFMDTTNWLELTPLVTTTCGSMMTT